MECENKICYVIRLWYGGKGRLCYQIMLLKNIISATLSDYGMDILKYVLRYQIIVLENKVGYVIRLWY